MALSMFLRSSACSSRVFTQQVMSMASQPAFQRAIARTLPVRTLALNEAKSTPILNAVRSFRTSAVRMSEGKVHDHSKLWVVEKAVAAALIPLLPIGLLIPNKFTDTLIALLVCAHTFWGLEAMVVEYVRVLLFGSFIPKVAMGCVYGLTVVMLGGLLYLIFNDIGLGRGFWRIWRNMKKPKGFEAIAVDYVRASIFGPVIPKIAIGLVYLLTIATLGGLFYIISHDVGIANLTKQIWAVKSDQQKA